VRPLDPRLTKHAAAARSYLVGTVVLGVVTAGLVLAQAGLLAHVIVHAPSGLSSVRRSLVVLAIVVAARAVTTYGGEAMALRAAAAVKSQLRRKLTLHLLALGPGWLGRQSTGELLTLNGRGLDALDPYFARYLPQLVLAVIIPAAVLARVVGADLVSAVTIAVTLPLIPVFMILIGMHTKARTDRQWMLLARLGGHFLDVVEGLPTLKLFGRAKAQAVTIRRVTEEHRVATMATLRIAFLSALALELLATLATAVVAVEVGLRLLTGHLGYETALVVLLLTPEAYLPLRQVGAQFHASMEGVTAAASVLDILETPVPAPASSTSTWRPDPGGEVIRFDQVSVCYPGRSQPALTDLAFAIRPGEHLAIVGPSGAGKTTVLSLLLRFVAPTSGSVEIGGHDLSAVDIAKWRRHVAWVPQDPHLFARSLAANIRLGVPGASHAAIRRAASLAGLDDVIATLPGGLDAMIGERGHDLSSGQRQRVAIARALLTDAPLLLLDEPAAHLDNENASDLRAVVRGLCTGRTVLVVTHSASWAADADRVLTLHDGRLVTDVHTARDHRHDLTGSAR
jgi:ATP-binding cassette, subfamily C, bacterial CydD